MTYANKWYKNITRIPSPFLYSILNIFKSAFSTPTVLELNNFICTVHFHRAVTTPLFGFHGICQNPYAILYYSNFCSKIIYYNLYLLTI